MPLLSGNSLGTDSVGRPRALVSPLRVGAADIVSDGSIGSGDDIDIECGFAAISSFSFSVNNAIVSTDGKDERSKRGDNGKGERKKEIKRGKRSG